MTPENPVGRRLYKESSKSSKRIKLCKICKKKTIKHLNVGIIYQGVKMQIQMHLKLTFQLYAIKKVTLHAPCSNRRREESKQEPKTNFPSD